MDFIDVVFPLRVGPLTYRKPAGNKFNLRPGMIVRAEIKKSLSTGIVVCKAASPPKGSIKEIADVPMDKPVFSNSMLGLLKWMSGYYLVPEGLALKSMLPMEVFENTDIKTRRKRKKMVSEPELPDLPLPDPCITSAVSESVARKEYKTYLLHAPDTTHEVAYMLELIKGLSNVIILCPETADIELTTPPIRDLFGERLTVLHGKLTKIRRREAYNNIISGSSDIVLGTRLAAFAPLPSISLIVVMQEQNRSYKNLEGLRYHARDVAVMRGYMDKAVVVLSSAAPSMDSFYNTLKKKYTLIKPDTSIKRPMLEIVNMKTAKKITPQISRRAAESAAACVLKNEGALFLINRKGHSIIQCADCSFIELCPECGVPLVYHADARLLKCHYCSFMIRAMDMCKRCKSTRLEMLGAGTQKIASDLKKYLGVEPLRVDIDSIKDDPLIKGAVDEEGIIVGTKIVARRFWNRSNYRLCAFLNPDTNLHLPDFRSAEFLFQEILNISEHIRSDGLLLIQTRMPENDVFRYIKKYNYTDFFMGELEKRKSLSYPPFSRIISVKLSSPTDITQTIMKALPPSDGIIEVLGPLSLTEKGMHVWKLIFKSTAKELLHQHAREFLKIMSGVSQLKIVADVDPAVI